MPSGMQTEYLDTGFGYIRFQIVYIDTHDAFVGIAFKNENDLFQGKFRSRFEHYPRQAVFGIIRKSSTSKM